MDRLLKIGFINVGHWILENDHLQYHLVSSHKRTNVLYSFISNGTVKYVGKTTMPLMKRMYGYQNPGPSQSTNTRVNARIIDTLKFNDPVDIFVLADTGLLKYGDFQINLAAGLEDTLINKIGPEWNYTGKQRIIEDQESASKILQDHMLDPPKSIRDFEIVLGQTYYNFGFFNVKKIYSSLFGADKEKIELQLGDKSNDTIFGYINRTANKNGSPRIIGGKELTKWFRSNFKQNDNLRISVLSPVSIRLIK